MDPPEVEDWADQDLLTKDEARDRLDDAIVRAQNRLAALQFPADEAEIRSVTRRLAAMESVRGEYDAYLHNQD
ncbi:hypothetical protein [Mycobacterium paraseoulense]|uniref:Uncharacterized protein n=1 Tax=Mycobacterium paraseoulense TaxID=590652 RepID=A0A1X0I9L6_9MYCO|nr:hypothetical protein [Mycobacterium paraseoulense]MCV7393960.1 hypothetical protein [Mycobacterium paraseoulense]ORB38434.1 hypothetical protein BST39_17345 [Mycobacterium paraseoulense]BBZ70410.1 hypothetical protein MPRS_15030 [Mycobacterium paraseoulense]